MIATFTLMADFGCFGWCHHGPEDEANPALGSGIWDGSYWNEKYDVIDDDLRRDLCVWHSRFEKGSVWNHEAACQFDWASFHAEGVALCRRLKFAFGSDVRVRYEKPAEDPDCGDRDVMQIEVDGTVAPVPWDHELDKQRWAEFAEEIRRQLEAD
ncbi:hypothetical protein AVO45_18075 [Ruegeria marisrubri]|uniref:Uncharacterized protein n=1 Tax=Ruegeria marisrubri TaxID=1685379 RepID=A0A0X3UAN6_9RHOB|nr:hypothetical protein [Ruegeria marisrubri]KUJ85157.1 hypothetical protein AVO45_18075 [Ruegeria marisrubri]